MDITPRSALSVALPTGMSLIVLYLLVSFIQQEGGPSITTLYVFSLFIAGGYFFLSAILLYIIRLLGRGSSKTGTDIPSLQQQVNRLETMKKDLEQKYYAHDISAETFQRQMEKVDDRLTYKKEELEAAQEQNT